MRLRNWRQDKAMYDLIIVNPWLLTNLGVSREKLRQKIDARFKRNTEYLLVALEKICGIDTKNK